MSEKHPWGKIDFMGKAVFFTVLSTVLSLAAITIFFTHKINYGIDFSGGTEVQVLFEKTPVTMAKLREVAEKLGYPNVSVQNFADTSEYLLRFESIKGASESEVEKQTSALAAIVSKGLIQAFPEENPEKLIRRVDTVGPTIGDELKRNSILAGFYSLIILLIYIGMRYDFRYAPSAAICTFHDATIALGLFIILGKEVNSQTLAAILTVMGYSLNDTVVNYDRIRENVSIHRNASLKNIMNLSVNEMLGRTILTSGTVFISTLALYFLAGGVIEDFAFLMLVGVVIGTYSSIYVAAPLVLLFEKMQGKPA